MRLGSTVEKIKAGKAVSPYDMDAIDPSYVSTVINPEDNSSRQ